ncbi:MAG: 1-deoxy-D-xylulose-5-phosphate reductoisomerase [Bacteroidota bacterium]|nr:1-deoxy-D-xylulose-5-phosphate reductoisomerase [Candidatus Kapabacteria bacterium]MCS7302293.1 1-deoxy-D-xylulose-5-phosphate reductoisomerase [Candidatus Kapabacteria bacterium]MCX7936302.1 1-deoxy-D-xylulose-5-phosphate reductoisomerase [Chlorobiota bacterium]MDW8074416.1 1-deoxy-D-xylulose-5-phosphate reductoisomerase [Bacteroidota bacterium]MDW8271108.1 1-deoxy-D-xylulose-5-phosphate reductoisomerase [Bacteroidota bacterium]
MKTISILGSTGSIGRQALDVIATYHGDLQLGFLTTNTNAELLAEQVERYKPYGVALCAPEAYQRFRQISSFDGPVLCGKEGIRAAAAWEGNDIVLSALVGFAGVEPTLAAIERGITVALANKEALVVAGELVMAKARHHNVPLLAVDSEHSAILQCTVGEHPDSIERVVLTASGGPFRNLPLEALEQVTPEQALRHPTWNMGAKITIDSATLMNKGFEVIEAYWLFGLSPEQISVLIHPQSIVHSFVEFTDGSVKAQLGVPDMRLPIHYALTYPSRRPTALPRIQWEQLSRLEFEPPDTTRFPCLKLALDALHEGKSAPVVLNAANEVAVEAFIQRRIRFSDIPAVIAGTLDAIPSVALTSLEIVIDVDRHARHKAIALVSHLQQRR